MNIEHRTSNVQHRIMYSARREPQGLMTWSNDQFKKKLSKANLIFEIRFGLARRRLRLAYFKIDKA